MLQENVTLILMKDPYFRVDFFRVLADTLLQQLENNMARRIMQGETKLQNAQHVADVKAVVQRLFPEDPPLWLDSPRMAIDTFMQEILEKVSKQKGDARANALAYLPFAVTALHRTAVEEEWVDKRLVLKKEMEDLSASNKKLREHPFASAMFDAIFDQEMARAALVKQHEQQEVLAQKQDAAILARHRLVQLAHACQYHPYPNQLEVPYQSLTGVYVPSETQRNYEGLASGAWLSCSFLLDITCMFLVKSNDTIFKNLDTQNAVSVLARLVFGMLTAFFVACVSEEAYARAATKALASHGDILKNKETLNANILIASSRFGEMLAVNMYGFQCAVSCVQLLFLLMPPAKLVWVIYVFATAIAGGVGAAIMTYECYKHQAKKDFKKEWDCVSLQGFAEDPNGLKSRGDDVAHYKYYAEQDFEAYASSPTFKAKLIGHVLAAFISNFTWQMLSLIPFGLGIITANALKPYVITLVSLLASIAMTGFVRIVNHFFLDVTTTPSFVPSFVPSCRYS